MRRLSNDFLRREQACATRRFIAGLQNPALVPLDRLESFRMKPHRATRTTTSATLPDRWHAKAAVPGQEIRITKVSPEYWRVTLDNPPYNIFGPTTIPQLDQAITEIESDHGFKADQPGRRAAPGALHRHAWRAVGVIKPA
jgi:hypothetical protein